MSARLKRLAVPVVSALVFVAIAALFDRDRIVGPGTLGEQETAAVLDTLTAFNKIYQDFYASAGSPKLIDDFPTVKRLKHFVYRDLGYLRDADLVLVLDMASMSLVETIRTSATTVDALVFEEWNYLYQRAATRKPISELKGMGHGFRYSLSQVDGLWKVTAWDFLDLDPPGAAE